jgi:hypothetical protein
MGISTLKWQRDSDFRTKHAGVGCNGLVQSKNQINVLFPVLCWINIKQAMLLVPATDHRSVLV